MGFDTGNEIVDQAAEFVLSQDTIPKNIIPENTIPGNTISENTIPAAWFRTIRKATGKPNLTAIIILSEIVYWYQPDILYGSDGEITGVKKRFEGDLLQRSYQQFAERFCINRRDATNAIVALEKLGVVKRIFRNARLGGRNISNILYLKLDVERLKELTYPEGMPESEKRCGCGSDESIRADRCAKADNHAVVSKLDMSRKITSINKGRSRFRTESETVEAPDSSESSGKAKMRGITENGDMAKMRDITETGDMAEMRDITETGDMAKMRDITETGDMAKMRGITENSAMKEMQSIAGYRNPAQISEMAKTGDIAVNGGIAENGDIRCVGYPTKIGETSRQNGGRVVGYPTEIGEAPCWNSRQAVEYPTEIGETPHQNRRQAVGYPTEIGETLHQNHSQTVRYPTQNGEMYPAKMCDSNAKPFQVYRTDNDREMDKDINIDPSYQSYQSELSRFQKQIDYDCLKFDYHNDERVDELVRIAVDALTSTAKTLRINCEDRPASVVKAKLRKLDMFHIQYILRCLNETTGKIRNMHTYLLSTLYNAINTIDCYYKRLLAENYRPPQREACPC
ncbi:MAG: DUF6017 domain-containing protein [Lachnospiraceae bacterium]|nr:DUF6017 domain-containing protein [Lachnospiraceae bacterium]